MYDVPSAADILNVKITRGVVLGESKPINPAQAGPGGSVTGRFNHGFTRIRRGK